MISVSNLTKRYGSFVAVNSISFTIADGEIFGFLGVNGAGKTTTLRMLAGILQPTEGTISICGHDLLQDPEGARRITGYIPDRPHLYQKLTGREYLHFIADLYSLPVMVAERNINQLLEKFALIQWQHELTENYSHGMKQRLATCGALLHGPKVLIVDEPMVGLDPHGAKLFKDVLRQYAREGMSILLSTHSLNVAEEISDRIAIIHGGRIITTGRLDEVRSNAKATTEDLEEIFLQLTAYSNDSQPTSL